MGWFKKVKQIDNEPKERLTVGQALRREHLLQGKASFEDVMEQLQECCSQYEDATENKLESEQEYEAVLSYLTDIQRIDELPQEQRAEAEELARTMIRLNEERIQFQDKEEKGISPARFLQMERYEEEVDSSLKTLKEQEYYREIINQDMRNLEGEKGAILFEKEEADRHILFFHRLSIVLVVLVGLTLLLLMYLMHRLSVAMMIPILITGTLALAMAAYIILSVRRLRYTATLAEAKKKKAIQLQNKVKIKLVACVSAIDFVYEKYGVSSYQELEYLRNQYQSMKAERERYRKNSALLEGYNAALAECLLKFGIKDPEVWVYQPEALIDSNEMVEVRHHMNERRRKVKERVQTAANTYELAHEELVQLYDAFPQYRESMNQILSKRGILL